jgi:signal-transduction protein with cAMP-binding, CBS, and nucleotidyltransferase domain
MQQLIDYIEQFVKLDSEATEQLKNLARIEVYAKNQHILEKGQRCNKIWFIKSGMVRKYYFHEGKEVTVWIHCENETFTSLQSYAQNTVSEEYLQACENTEVISISKSNSEKLARFPQIMVFVNAMMGKEFANIDKHTKELNQREAKGRYEYLGEIAPEIIKRAKLGHIASILGISQETLSRIRKS